MEVTRKNFKQVWSILPDALEKAQFVAFDVEFTGLRTEGMEKPVKCDTLESYYTKMKLLPKLFIPIQYGIVLFYFNKKENRYSHQAFNFYIYPSELSSTNNFTCQATSIKFLVEHGIDFNKVFGEGIPYIRNTDFNEYLTKLDGEKEMKMKEIKLKHEDYKKVVIPNDLKELLSGVLDRVDSCIVNNRKEQFVTEKLNRFARYLIFQSLKKYNTKVFVTVNADETMKIDVGLTDVEYANLIELKYKHLRDKAKEDLGFTEIIKLIAHSGKLCVGHNLFLDLLYTVDNFFCPLPNKFSECCESIHAMFPNIIDTKYLAADPKLKLSDTNLYKLFEYLKNCGNLPEVPIDLSGAGYCHSDNLIHEAAYDAYLTGVCFIAICNKLGQNNIHNSLLSSELVMKTLNKLNVPKMEGVSCIALEGCYEEPDRSNVFYLKFPKEYREQDVKQIFSYFGDIDIHWLNDTSAYICVRKELAHEVMSYFRNSPVGVRRFTFEIRTFNERLKSLWKRNHDPEHSKMGFENNENSDSASIMHTVPIKRERRVNEDLGKKVD